MAKIQNNSGMKIMSAAALAVAIGAAAYFWSGGEGSRAEAVLKQDVVEMSTRPLYYEMRSMVVNLTSNSSKTRYLKVRPTLVTRHKAFYRGLEDAEPLIRNNLLSLYAMKSAEDLLQPEGFEHLRQESLASLQEILKDESGVQTLSDVLFTEFVIQ